MESTCRLCLSQKGQLMNLFQHQNGHLIADLVKIICPISIQREDPLPKAICNDCYETIVNACHLRDLSIINEQNLMENVHQEQQINLITEDDDEEKFAIEMLYDDDIIEESYDFVEEEEISVPVPKVEQIIVKTENIKKSEKYLCELCNQRYSNSSSLKRHQLRKHRNAKYQCDHCPLMFKTKNDIDQHMKKRHVKLHPDVNFLYEDRLTLDLNELCEKLDEPLPLFCIYCAYKDYDMNALTHHLESHQPVIETGKMYCGHCATPITTLEFMIEHTKMHNEKVRTHRCLICNRTFPYDIKFLNHLRSHKKNQHRICFCPDCGRKFSRPKTLQDHIRFIHRNEALFCCSKCGQGFGSKSALNGHVKRHIEGNKFQCPFCPKTFASHNLLNFHKMVHVTDRPFECHLCNKTFKYKKNLDDHVSRHEGTRKSYQCTICQKTFNSTYALKRHCLTHTQEKPWYCEYCEKSYAQKGDLTKHLKQHVGENIYPCEYEECTLAFQLLRDLRLHEGIHYVRSEEQKQ